MKSSIANRHLSSVGGSILSESGLDKYFPLSHHHRLSFFDSDSFSVLFLLSLPFFLFVFPFSFLVSLSHTQFVLLSTPFASYVALRILDFDLLMQNGGGKSLL